MRAYHPSTRAGIAVLITLWWASAVSAMQPAAPNVRSDSYIEIDGRGIKHERFVLQFDDGEWFVRPGREFAGVTVKTASGTPLTLSVQWFGTRSTHTIDAAGNSDSRGNHAGFFLDLTGPEPRNVHAVPYGDEVLKLAIATFTDHDIEATFEGEVNELTVNGRIKLHRDVEPKRRTTGTFRDCDPVIYDALYGADARSPSECEQKFDTHVRDTIQRALVPAIAAFEAQGWVLESPPAPWPITSVGRGLEKEPFTLSYGLALRLDPAGDAMQKRLEALEAIKDKVSSEIQLTGRPGPSVPEFNRLSHDLQFATRIGISVSINMPGGGGLSAYSREQKTLSVPGAVFAVSSRRAVSGNGGGPDNASEFTGAWFGHLAAPVVQTHDDGGEAIVLSPRFDRRASTLLVQTIGIGLVSNAELADAFLRRIDLAALTSLLTP